MCRHLVVPGPNSQWKLAWLLLSLGSFASSPNAPDKAAVTSWDSKNHITASEMSTITCQEATSVGNRGWIHRSDNETGRVLVRIKKTVEKHLAAGNWRSLISPAFPSTRISIRCLFGSSLRFSPAKQVQVTVPQPATWMPLKRNRLAIWFTTSEAKTAMKMQADSVRMFQL